MSDARILTANQLREIRERAEARPVSAYRITLADRAALLDHLDAVTEVLHDAVTEVLHEVEHEGCNDSCPLCAEEFPLPSISSEPKLRKAFKQWAWPHLPRDDADMIWTDFARAVIEGAPPAEPSEPKEWVDCPVCGCSEPNHFPDCPTLRALEAAKES